MSAHPDSTGASRAVTTSPIRRFRVSAASAGTRPSRTPFPTGLGAARALSHSTYFELCRAMSTLFLSRTYHHHFRARLLLQTPAKTQAASATPVAHSRRLLRTAISPAGTGSPYYNSRNHSQAARKSPARVASFNSFNLFNSFNSGCGSAALCLRASVVIRLPAVVGCPLSTSTFRHSNRTTLYGNSW
jgi:hypothetical protein